MDEKIRKEINEEMSEEEQEYRTEIIHYVRKISEVGKLKMVYTFIKRIYEHS